MARKDILTKKYMKKPHIFADFFNGFIYDGQQVIDWSTLEELDSSMLSVVPVPNGKRSETVQKYRDIIKKSVIMKSNRKVFALLGIENQSDIHYAMPVRDMIYDAIAYLNQVEEQAESNRQNGECSSDDYISGFRKTDKLMPVITVTLYWGARPWDGPTSLKEMIEDVDPELDRFINDYKLNLFSIIDAKIIPEYHTQLRELFLLLNARNDADKMKKVVEKDEVFSHIDRETAELIRDFSSLKLPRVSKEGDYDMCKAVRDLEQRGIEKGLVQGIEKGIEKGTIDTLVSLVRDGLLEITEAAKRAGISVDEMNARL